MAKALSPALPHQTVHSVFPNTAFRSSSSSGFRSLSPWGRGGYLIQSKSAIEVFIRERFITPALQLMSPPQINPHALLKEPLQEFQIFTTVPVVKISCPSPYSLIELLDDHLFRQCQITPHRQVLKLRPDLCQGFLGGSDEAKSPTRSRVLYHHEMKSKKTKALFPDI